MRFASSRVAASCFCEAIMMMLSSFVVHLTQAGNMQLLNEKLLAEIPHKVETKNVCFVSARRRATYLNII